MSPPRFRPPAWWLGPLELRAFAEYASFMATFPLNRRAAPLGDGHPVMVIPGFLAPDASTAPMRRLLRQLGYDVHGWGQGFNTGPRTSKIAPMRRQLHDLAASAPGGVSLVGWSLGGMYARVLAKENPEVVRSVVALASPFRLGIEDRTRASAMFDALEKDGERDLWSIRRDEPMPVPFTSVITRLDGVVDWRACVTNGEPQTETIEVRGASHFGLGHNPAALAVVTDRLAQPPGQWRPYRVPSGLQSVLARYPGH